MQGPLDGYRILDFTRYQQGPYSTVLLSDLGAEIWKVEPPGGDPGRASDLSGDGFSRYFEAHDRGKRSIVLNLRDPAAVEAALKMAEHCDGVIENYRPGVMDRLGLSYETLRDRNAKIVMVSASAFGAEGPQAGEPGYDIIGQATGGVMTLQALGSDAEPRTLPGGFADQVGAMQACIAMLAGLLAAKDSGRGQHVDVSLLGSQIALQSVYVTGFLQNGQQPHMRRRRMPTFTFYQAEDGRWLVIGVVDAKNWRALCELMDHPEWEHDERFATAPARMAHSDELESLLEGSFATLGRDEWLGRLREADIPAAPVNDYADVEASEQVWANGYLTEIPDPRYGSRRVTGLPWSFSETPGAVQGRAPELNVDADSILAECGYSVEEVVQLRESGALPG